MRIGLRPLVLGAAALWLLAPAASAAGATVALTPENTFSPSSIEVDVGDTVTFRWDGGFHNVDFDDGTRSGDPTDQAALEWSRTFTDPGTYPYVCVVHASVGMKGTVTVSGTSGSDDNSGSGGNAVSDGNQGASSYPHTGPESGLIPGIGFLLLAGGSTGFLIEKRRRARRRS